MPSVVVTASNKWLTTRDRMERVARLIVAVHNTQLEEVASLLRVGVSVVERVAVKLPALADSQGGYVHKGRTADLNAVEMVLFHPLTHRPNMDARVVNMILNAVVDQGCTHQFYRWMLYSDEDYARPLSINPQSAVHKVNRAINASKMCMMARDNEGPTANKLKTFDAALIDRALEPQTSDDGPGYSDLSVSPKDGLDYNEKTPIVYPIGIMATCAERLTIHLATFPSTTSKLISVYSTFLKQQAHSVHPINQVSGHGLLTHGSCAGFLIRSTRSSQVLNGYLDPPRQNLNLFPSRNTAYREALIFPVSAANNMSAMAIYLFNKGPDAISVQRQSIERSLSSAVDWAPILSLEPQLCLLALSHAWKQALGEAKEIGRPSANWTSYFKQLTERYPRLFEIELILRGRSNPMELNYEFSQPSIVASQPPPLMSSMAIHDDPAGVIDRMSPNLPPAPSGRRSSIIQSPRRDSDVVIIEEGEEQKQQPTVAQSQSQSQSPITRRLLGSQDPDLTDANYNTEYLMGHKAKWLRTRIEHVSAVKRDLTDQVSKLRDILSRAIARSPALEHQLEATTTELAAIDNYLRVATEKLEYLNRSQI